ncbi:ABC transporter permease [uncultured Desulfuromonas sp.]|uniref:ABC transporter permease n=1 Tax=uncultured Desulfuromonas sp. TaxID=181013 RepID=UPI002615BF6E|nr:ABC transporter permease [uncultured Desulfuromonas sp.]
MFLLKLIVRNAFRHKLRSTLTVLGIAVAILAFGLLRTLIGAWYLGVEASAANRLVTRNAISLVFSLPLSYKDRIKQVDGVEKVSIGNWFGGIYIDRKNFFPNFAVEPESYLELYPEFVIPPQQKSAFVRDRRGAVAGANLAERFGWQVGDQITLQGTIFPGDWDLVLRGIYRGLRPNTDQTQFFFHWDYLNETMKKTAPRRADQVGFYMIGLSHPDQAAEASAAIDALFKNSLAETLTETEKAFQLSFVAMSGAIITAIRIVSIVVIVIIMVVAANTMAMTARERIAEYATLKTLGFGAHHIAGAVFGESMLIALSGGALGLLLTYPAAAEIGRMLAQFIPVFRVPPETVWLDLAAAVTVGFVAGIFPTWRGATINIAEGLRRIG